MLTFVFYLSVIKYQIDPLLGIHLAQSRILLAHTRNGDGLKCDWFGLLATLNHLSDNECINNKDGMIS